MQVGALSAVLSQHDPFPLPSDNNTFTDALTSKDTMKASVGFATEGGLMDSDEVRFNARIPFTLRDAFADLCERKGTTMTGAVQRYMLRAVEEGETGP